MSMTRRSFLVSLAAAAAATEIDAQTGMPMRTLGSTGQKVSLLAFGAGSRWLAYKERDKAPRGAGARAEGRRELRRQRGILRRRAERAVDRRIPEDPQEGLFPGDQDRRRPQLRRCHEDHRAIAEELRFEPGGPDAHSLARERGRSGQDRSAQRPAQGHAARQGAEAHPLHRRDLAHQSRWC